MALELTIANSCEEVTLPVWLTIGLTLEEIGAIYCLAVMEAVPEDDPVVQSVGDAIAGHREIFARFRQRGILVAELVGGDLELGINLDREVLLKKAE